MSGFYYDVQLERGVKPVCLESPGQVFELLKKKKFVRVLRYNDKKTGIAYAKEAADQELSAEEQAKRPVCVMTVLSEEGIFVENEAFWMENYMFDEFYNPERMPYIEKVIKQSNEGCSENDVE